MDKIVAAVIVTVLVTGIHGNNNSPFREGVEYRYEYSANTTTGSYDGSATCGAGYGIQAKLFVQISSGQAQLKFRDVSVSAHNLAAPCVGLSDGVTVDSSVISSQLAKPFFIQYTGSKITAFATDSKDPTWVKNFKRATAGLLQFTLGDAVPESTTVLDDTELTVYGTCPVSNSITNSEEGIVLEKQRHLEDCSLYPSRIRTTMRAFKCGTKKTSLIDKSSVVKYKITMNRANPEIQDLVAQGTVNLSPFADGGSNHPHFVSQTLSLKKTARINTAVEVPKNIEFLPDLRFQFANTKLDLAAVDNFYLAGEGFGSVDDQAQLRQSLLISLLDVVEIVYEPPKNDRLTDRASLLKLIPLINLLDYSNLVTFYRQDLPAPINDKLSSARTLFLDGLAMSGSNPAALLIRDLIRGAELPELVAAKLLATFPVYVRRSSMALVNEISKLIGLPLAKGLKYNVVEEALALAIPTLVNKACTNQIAEYVDCSPEEVAKWTEHFIRQYKVGGTYQQRLTAIYGLRNLGVYLSPVIADFVKGVALGKEEAEGPLRSHAIVILLEGIPFNPTIAPAVLSIYKNSAEPRQVRIAAAGTLLSGIAPVKYIRQIVTSLLSEKDPDVEHYVITTLKAVRESSHPCLKESIDFIRPLLRSLPRVQLSHRRSSNYIYDFVHPTNQFGSLLQLHTVANPTEDFPLTVAGIMNYYIQDFTFDAYRFSVVLDGAQGLIPDLSEFIGGGAKGDLPNVQFKEKLLTIMQSLKSIGSPHIEVVFTFQGHTAMAYKFNEQKYNQIMNSKDVELFLQDFKLNFQVWQSAASAIYTVPNELGMPVSATLDMTGLFSNRIELNKLKSSGKLARKLNFDLVTQFDVSYGLSNYFEGMKSFFNVRQEGKALLHLPLELDIAIDLRKQEFDFKYIVPTESSAIQLASDSRTVTQISDDHTGRAVSESVLEILKKSCGPTCNPSLVVKPPIFDQDGWSTVLNFSSTLLGMEASAQYKDCRGMDGSSFFSSLQKEALDPSGFSFRGNFLAALYLWTNRLQHSILLESDGKLCAQRARLHQSRLLPTTQLPFHSGSPVIFRESDLKGPVIPTVEIVGKLRSRMASDEKNPAGSVFESGKSQIRLEMNWKGEKKDSDRKTDFDFVFEHSGSGAKQLLNIRVKVDASPAHKIQDFMICLKAEGTFPTSSSYDLYDISGLAGPPEVSTTVDFVMGKVASLAGAQCPTDQFRLKLNLQASGSDDVLELKKKATAWPYDECKKDEGSGKWPGHITPQTSACFERAVDFTTLRNYNADVKILDIPPSIEITIDRLKNAVITALLPYWSAEKVGKPITTEGVFQFGVNVTFKRGEKLDAIISQSDFRNSFKDVPIGQFSLSSAQISSALKSAIENDVLSSCSVTPSTVVTLDKVKIPLTLRKCMTLVSADCSESGSFGVFVKKIDGPVPLALQVYYGNHSVEIITNGKEKKNPTIKVDGMDAEVPSSGLVVPESKEKSAGLLRIRYYKPFYTISSTATTFYVQFSGHHVTFYPPMNSKGKTCGLCGNSDRDFKNDLRTPDGCDVGEEAFSDQFVVASECSDNFEKLTC